MAIKSLEYKVFKSFKKACRFLNSHVSQENDYENKLLGKNVTSVFVYIEGENPICANFTLKDANGLSMHFTTFKKYNSSFKDNGGRVSNYNGNYRKYVKSNGKNRYKKGFSYH